MMSSVGMKRKTSVAEAPSGLKRRKSGRSTGGSDSCSLSSNDSYCWICHKEGEVICCETCPRVFHLKCIQLSSPPTEDWVCPECVLIMTAENMETRSRAMRLLSVEQLCSLLKHALSRLRAISGVEPFVRAVDPIQFPAYRDYVYHPMDLLTLEKNIRKKQYGSTEAFLADLKWILHNCIIFNSLGSKLSNIAKQLVKICKHEMQEIENCPDCYTNAHTKKDSWFIAACRIPHLLVWAKLKGFPFWPAKAMRVNAEDHVDVRFFGAHDRAWVPMRDVYIYSQEPPVPIKNKKKGNLEGCINEVELYIKNITDKCGEFRFAPAKTPFDAKREEEQIKLLYPKCTLPFDIGPIRTRARSLSFSGSERSCSRTPTPTEDESRNSKTDLTSEEASAESKKAADSKDISKETITDKAEEGDNHQKVVREEEMEEEDAEEEVDDVEPENEDAEKKGPEESTSTSDRVAASPPCEVSSTTTTASDATSKSPSKASESNKPPPTTGEENTSKPEPKLAVIAETSETVIIEGDEDEDEEEIDDDEEAVINDAEIDDVEPEGENDPSQEEEKKDEEGEHVEEKSSQIESKAQDESSEEGEKEGAASDSLPEENVVTGTPEEKEKEAASDAQKPTEIKEKTAAPPATSREEEIDDVEPETAEAPKKPPPEEVVPTKAASEDKSEEPSVPMEQDQEEEEEEEEEVESPLKEKPEPSEGSRILKDGLDTSRLLASGVSVTIKSKPLSPHKTPPSFEPGGGESSKESEQRREREDEDNRKIDAQDPKEDLNSELSLGSDISVTVVQKKKENTTPHQIPPRISVKKESELLAGSTDKPRDVVHVSRTRKAPPSQIRKSVEESMESDKNPPDPIVTISKVQALVSGVPPSKADSLKSAPPLTTSQQSRKSNAPSLPPPNHSSSSRNGPLVNMLGAPRMIPPPHHQHRGRAMSQSSMMRGPPVSSSGQSVHPMGMPSLHPRPQGLFSVPPPLPSAAGPVSEQLNRVAGKLVDYMRLSLEELFREMASSGSPEATIKALQIEIEKMQWRHQQELAETRHNAELKFQELQHAMEAEKQKIVSDLKKQAELDKQKAVGEAKKKQWCSHCGKEAIFYCCWNTSYCDYPCQQAHWPTHMSTCAQNQANNDEDGLNASGGSNSSSTPEVSQSHSSDSVDHPTAAGHFLSNSGGRSQSNGMMPPHSSRGMQPMMMPFGHSGINPRLMSQIGMRFCGPHPGGGGPRGGNLPAHLRFPGNYFM